MPVERQFSDVVIIIDLAHEARIEEIAEQLRGMGMQVRSIDHDQSIIRGTVPSDKLAAVRKMPGVNYVRIVFSYLAGKVA